MVNKKKGPKKGTKSIGSPLGRIKINSEVAEEPITKQIRKLLDKDK